jgi:hypothetical protein
MTDLDRFFSKVEITPSCWIWKACKTIDGYGTFWFDGKMVRAHKFIYEYINGKILKGLEVRHKECHNPSCVNPDHLDIGTHQDNMSDMVLAGRQAKGETNGRSKLTQNSVEVIRELYPQGITQESLAEMFGVSDVQICLIVNNKSWVTSPI